MIKKYILLIMGLFSALTILVFNIVLINTPSIMFFNYGIGFFYGLLISIGSSIALGNKRERVFIFTFFSTVVFFMYFGIKALVFYLFDELVFAEYLATLLNTYLFIYGYLRIYKIRNTDILIPVLLIGSSTFWMEFYPEKILGVAVVFFGMFFWQLFISLYLNKLVETYGNRD